MSNILEAKEPQNQKQFDNYFENGGFQLGPYTTHIWKEDPRHLSFLLARYKFCAKMLSGKNNVLEVGCGDSVGTPIVLQETGKIHCIDFEPIVIEDAEKRNLYKERCSYAIHDMLEGPVKGEFDGAFCLDVIEHIPSEQEKQFIKNIADSLTEDGVMITGTPNITAREYASEYSQLGHINLKSGETLKNSLRLYFKNVFLFSMNDEVVHTGYSPMAHYLICIGVGKK